LVSHQSRLAADAGSIPAASMSSPAEVWRLRPRRFRGGCRWADPGLSRHRQQTVSPGV